MKNIIFTLCFIISLSSVTAQNQEMLDTLSRSEIKMMIDHLAREVISLRKTILSNDSCYYSHEKYMFCESINADTISTIVSPWSFMNFKLLSAVGDRKKQIVTITLILTNTDLHQKLYIDGYGSEAIDPIGHSSGLEKIQVGSGSHIGTAYTNVPIRIHLTFKGVFLGTDKFNFVALKMSAQNANSTQGITDKNLLEISNVPIKWLTNE